MTESPIPPPDAATRPCSSQLLPAECSYVGRYTRAGAETLYELLLLDDHHFCLGVMVGGEDMVITGRWGLDEAKGQGISLKEQRTGEAFWAEALEDGILDPTSTVVLSLNGGLHDTPQPVFAVGLSDTPPATLRPVFGYRQAESKRTYDFAPAARSRTRFVFYGGLVRPTPEAPARLRVLVFEVPPTTLLRIGYVPSHARPLFNAHSALVDGKLKLDGDNYGEPAPLTASMVESARKACMLDEPAGEAGNRRRRGATETWTVLSPKRVLDLDPNVVQGTPLL